MTAGRVEARIKIPTGGSAVSATNSGGGPTTVTIPAGNYYYTAAGGISALLTGCSPVSASVRARHCAGATTTPPARRSAA